jgi:transporter family protein
MKSWILPAFATILFWGFWAFLPKLVYRYVGITSALLYQVVGSILVGIAVMVLGHSELQFNPTGFVLGVLTGVLGYLGLLAFLITLSRGPVTLAVPLTALYPALAVILAFLFLRETVTLKQGIGILLSFGAVFLISS